MKKLLLLLFLFLLTIAIINIESTGAQVSDDWTINPDWNGTDLPTPTPAATPTSTPYAVITNVFIASLSAIGMFAVVPIISTAGLIITVTMMMRSGEEVDPKIIVAGAVLVIVVNVFAVAGILIINGVQTAMPVT